MRVFRSMRVRLALSFVVLLALFGWILSRAISHSALLQIHYDQAAQQHHIRIALTLFMGILFPAVAIGAWLLVGRTLRPLRALSRQASEASTEHLKTRLVSPSSDTEMTELVETINGLLERIETTAAAKAQFYGAASHELRTPLQALSGHLETALSQERDADGYHHALLEAQSQTARLVTLTRDILLLHHLQDPGVSDAERADVAESMRVAVRELTPLVDARGLSMESSGPDALGLPGRQSYADVAIRNLVENAARYSSPGGHIVIELTSEGFRITNDCEPDDNVSLESLFEPFTRPAGGNGLGLAVCRAAAKANGWSVSLARTPRGVAASIAFKVT